MKILFENNTKMLSIDPGPLNKGRTFSADVYSSDSNEGSLVLSGESAKEGVPTGAFTVDLSNIPGDLASLKVVRKSSSGTLRGLIHKIELKPDAKS